MQNEPSASPFAKFESLVQKIVSVPKTEIDRREQEYKKEREKKKREK